MKYGSWAAGAASAAVVVGLALYIDASETGQTDGGLQVDTGAPGAAASPQGCVGSRPGPGASSEGTDDTPLFRTLARVGDLAAGPHADVYTEGVRPTRGQSPRRGDSGRLSNGS
ncbi:hypothetical protein OQI_33610 [Streptomyces pharetrae CZA14]|uniref:Uncharacterized protein n=1 Tax=Streptomyces pharetrae CZA14 TaxID=1144883 RepID=A0ABX3Y938_9ACTN|nr:hypothetical protein OQI_33610 [Streptomyces pharetrae CZA14]